METDPFAQATRDAKRDGVFAGMSSGLVAALIGSRFMGFTRNKTIFCGVLTGLLSGYLFNQAFLSSNLARLKARTDSAILIPDLRDAPTSTGSTAPPNHSSS